MKRFDEPILVTRPYLPDLAAFKSGIDEVWRNQWLTNNGPMVQRFHAALAERLGVAETNLALFNNGTLALEMGFKALGLEGGDVVTTPFTFVATSHALVRTGARPVFADVDPETLCLSPAAAEKMLTSRTKAIVPVHVYGNVCDVEGFEALSKKYGIPVIYDAAHAFGIPGIEKHGAMSMFSFHPTKLFHSCEGGLLVFRDAALQPTLFDLRNFAIHSQLECVDVGTNAKMNELQGLMGLLCLKELDGLLARRRVLFEAYASVLDGVEGIRLLHRSENCAYVPVLFRDFATRERVYEGLKNECNVFARRYFYPLLTDFAPYVYAKGTCPVAEEAASRVLTLPTYDALSPEDAAAIAENVKELAS